MNEQIIARIINTYGLNWAKLLPVEKGYRNESHPFITAGGQIANLIIYKRELNIVQTIRLANRTSNFLAERGFPVRRTLDPRLLCLNVNSWRRYAGLYNYLFGQTIPWEAYTKQHLKLIGAMLSNLHDELKSLPPAGYPAVTDQYLNYWLAMKQYFTDPGVKASLSRKLSLSIDGRALKQTKLILLASRQLLHQQVLHLDFVRSNILFTTSQRANQPTDLIISGVLDFEKTAYGHPLFDIARNLAFLLVDCKYKTEAQIRKYFLLSGYQKRGSSHLPHVKLRGDNSATNLLERLIDIFLLYDFYKFLKHNPYENLADNEHFLRTRDQLLTRQMIYGNDTIKQS